MPNKKKLEGGKGEKTYSKGQVPSYKEDGILELKRVVEVVIVNDDSGTEDDPDGDYSRC